MAGHKVRFTTAAGLMLQLAAAKAEGRLKEYFNVPWSDPSCWWPTRSDTCRSGATSMKIPGAPRVAHRGVRSSQATPAAVDNSAPLATRPEST